MKYLEQLTEEEVRYICTVIPLQETIKYFNHYPKDFVKIMPGFRPASLKSQEQAGAVLFKKRKDVFISSFIEKHIERWICEINESIRQRIDSGDSKEEALLNTLPLCFFIDNIRLYFKLINEEYPEDYIILLGKSIKSIKDLDEKRRKLQTVVDDAEKQEIEFKHIKFELNETRKKLKDSYEEVKRLKKCNDEHEKLKSDIQAKEKVIGELKFKTGENEKYIQQLNTEILNVKNRYNRLEKQINQDVKKQNTVKAIRQIENRKPKRPKDIDDFKEYLEDNLKSIGVQTNEEYFVLLKEHLSEILFQGKPIVVNRITGEILIKSIANTLIGTSKVLTLTFDTKISEQMINEFLSVDTRIVCLDNFIGNFNETILLEICNKYKDKIIFLTITYDRTLFFVPNEFMKYCNYLNLDRINAFNKNPDIIEKSSLIDEEEYSNSMIFTESKWTHLLKDLLRDFGFNESLFIHKSSFISDERSLCRILVFEILPYCVDVFLIEPFNTSERLNKYASKNGGRCLYKDLLGRWFE